jgi:hypothetical protein
LCKDGDDDEWWRRGDEKRVEAKRVSGVWTPYIVDDHCMSGVCEGSVCEGEMAKGWKMRVRYTGEETARWAREGRGRWRGGVEPCVRREGDDRVYGASGDTHCGTPTPQYPHQKERAVVL